MPPKYIWEQARLYTVSYKSISKAIPLCASCHEEVDLSLWIETSRGRQLLARDISLRTMTIPRAGNYNCLGDNANFNNAILGYHPAGFLNAKRIINELYTCSDEGDMQGRFNNNVILEIHSHIGDKNQRE
ncbi:hypothetical protein DTO212C5_5491 [Paecilomyces variotii]|nr:hypothetical protein DTO212C5_5491 [Paecilomyces variotii]KAJ9375615.1 hypothetical protein DTO063F5_9245 [Paecilomyces variotii]